MSNIDTTKYGGTSAPKKASAPRLSRGTGPTINESRDYNIRDAHYNILLHFRFVCALGRSTLLLRRWLETITIAMCLYAVLILISHSFKGTKSDFYVKDDRQEDGSSVIAPAHKQPQH